MGELVLSIFPGIGLLDYAFEEVGFTTVRGPDPLWGGDIRRFSPPAGRFEGVIGGDPCQSFSALSNLVRAKGLEPSFGDLSGEYQRVVEATRPIWFLRENVVKAPDIAPPGYETRSFVLDNSNLDSGDGWGNEQMRRRRFWFGVRDDHGPCPELRKYMDFALFQLPEADRTQAVAGGDRDGHGAIGGSGRRKVTADGGHDGIAPSSPVGKLADARKADLAANPDQRVGKDGRRLKRIESKKAPVTGRNEGAVGAPGVDYGPPKRSLGEMCRLQGLPEDYLDHQPWTMSAKRKMVGNGVAIMMGRQLAGAIRAWREG